MGVTGFHSIAIESDEFGGDQLQKSIATAERALDELVDRLVAEADLRQAA